METWEFWGPIVSDVLREVMPYLLLALFGYIVKRVLPAIKAEYEQHIDVKTRENLEFVGRWAVTLAEQIAKREDFQKDAARKKALAYELFNQKATGLKLNIQADEVEDWIEYAVGQVNHEKTLAEAAVKSAQPVPFSDN